MQQTYQSQKEKEDAEKQLRLDGSSVQLDLDPTLPQFYISQEELAKNLGITNEYIRNNSLNIIQCTDEQLQQLKVTKLGTI